MDIVRRRRLPFLLAAVAAVTGTAPRSSTQADEVAAAGSVDSAPELLKTYCVRCHNADKHKADVDLTAFGPRPDSLRSLKVWKKVLIQLQDEEMPPEDPQPTS